jgi:hypothetical protein
MNKLSELKKVGFRKVGFWKLQKPDENNRNSNSISFYFDIDRDLCYSSENCAYAFVSNESVLYIGKTNQGLARRMTAYSGTSNALNKAHRDRKTLSDRHKVEFLIARLEKSENIEIYAFHQLEPILYKGININLIAGIEDPLIEKIKPILNEDSIPSINTQQVDLILNKIRLKAYENKAKEEGYETFAEFMRTKITEFEFKPEHNNIEHFSFSYTEFHKKKKIYISEEQEKKLYDISKEIKQQGKSQSACFILDRVCNLNIEDMKHLDTGVYVTSKSFPKRSVLRILPSQKLKIQNLMLSHHLGNHGAMVRKMIDDLDSTKELKMMKYIMTKNEDFHRVTYQFTDEQFEKVNKLSKLKAVSLPQLIQNIIANY